MGSLFQFPKALMHQLRRASCAFVLICERMRALPLLSAARICAKWADLCRHGALLLLTPGAQRASHAQTPKKQELLMSNRFNAPSFAAKFAPASALAAVLGAALTFGAFAQSTETTEEAPIAPIETDLSLGEDASAPQVGQTYVKEVIQDWELQCVRADSEAEEPCQMYQLLQDEDGNPVAEVSLFRLPTGGQAIAGATVIVPLETSLQAQLRLSVDGGQGKRYPYSFCNAVGCFARIGLTEADVNGFKRGAKATLTLVPFLAPDQTVALDMSLKGFTASFDKVTVVTQ